MKFVLRKVHSYLSLFISIQLLLWTVSGIYFAFNKIEDVRGEQYREKPQNSVNFQKINFEISDAENISFISRGDLDLLIVQDASGRKYLDYEGNDVKKITYAHAQNIVTKKTNLEPLEVNEITEGKKGSEFRGRNLPIYQIKAVNDKDEEINVYINPYSGEVAAIRSTQWRIWDLMWGFHIMDWEERDNIDNFFLQLFSILALVSAITGIVLFFKRKA